MFRYMKAAIGSLAILLMVFSVTSTALERTNIAESAQDVTPLLAVSYTHLTLPTTPYV